MNVTSKECMKKGSTYYLTVSCEGISSGMSSLKNLSDYNENGLGRMTLANLKANLFDQTEENDKLLDLVKQKRRADSVDELRKLKIEHRKLRAQKQKESLEIQKTMIEMEKKKQMELKLRLEKERLKQNFEKVDKSNLNKLETNKRRELEKLTQEKNILVAKEEAILAQVEALEKEVLAQEELEQQRRGDLEKALNKKGMNRVQQKQGEMLQLAVSHGHRVSKLKMEKQTLEQERELLDEEMKKLRKNSPLNSPRETLDDLVRTIEISLSEKQLNLTKMKQEFENDTNSLFASRANDDIETQILKPNTIDKRVPFTTEAESFLTEWLEMDQNRPENHGAVLSQANRVLDEFNRIPPEESKLTEAEIPTVVLEKSEKELVEKETEQFSIHEELRKLKQEYYSLGIKDPNLWSQIQQLEMHCGGRRYATNDTSVIQELYRPSKMQQYVSNKPSKKKRNKGKKCIESSDSETSFSSESESSDSDRRSRKKKSDKKYKKSSASKMREQLKLQAEIQKQRTLFAQTVEQMGQKIRKYGNNNAASSSCQPSTGPPNQFVEELNTLELIPKDTELYDIQLAHLQHMTKMKLEIDSLKQEQTLQSLKKQLEQESREQQKKNDFDEKLLEHQRNLELAKVKKAISKESVSTAWAPTSASYDPMEGFFMYFDYITGIPKRFEKIRVVFCIYDGETAKTSAKALLPCETVTESLTKVQASIADRKRFQKVPSLVSLVLVLEVQSVAEDSKGDAVYQSIGWTTLNMFKLVSNNVVLEPAPLKLPLRKPPFKESSIRESMNMEQSEVAPMIMFVRLVHFADADAATEFLVDPALTQHLYSFPNNKQQQQRRRSSNANPRKVSNVQPEEVQVVEEEEKVESDEDSVSDIASIVESVLSSARSVVSRRSSSKPLVPIKRRTTVSMSNLEFESDDFDENSLMVKMCLLSEDKSYDSHDRPGKLVRIWETAAENSGLGKFVFNQPTCPITFFDDLKLSVSSLLLFKISVQNEDESEELLMWGTLPIMDKDGMIHVGSHQVSLYLGAIDLPLEEDNAHGGDAKLTFIIEEHARASSSSGSSRHSRKSFRSKQKTNLDIESIAEEDLGESEDEEISMWREIVNPTPSRKNLFVKGVDGYDIYVDGLRGLPDFVTISQIRVKLLDQTFSTVGDFPVVTETAKQNESASSPGYSIRVECRDETAAVPTATLLLRIDTVNRFSKKSEVVGYGTINVFCDPATDMAQPSKSTLQDYVLNQGEFQISLHRLIFDQSQKFSASYVVENNCLRVPCATALVRIVKCKKSKDGLKNISIHDYPKKDWERLGIVVRPPRYTSKTNTYDSSRCVPLACEELLYQNMNEKAQVLVAEMATFAKRPGLDNEVDVMEEEELNQWMNSRLETSTGLCNDIVHIAPCSSESGIKVQIQRLINLKKPGFRAKPKLYKVIYSMSPPGLFYTEPKLTDDTAFTTSHDWNSSYAQQQFADAAHCFRDISPCPDAVLIVEIRELVVANKSDLDVQSHSWGVLPLFQDGIYTRSGIHQVPLFEGPPNAEMLKEYHSDPEVPWQEFLAVEMRSKRSRIKFLKGFPSLIVLVVDGQITECVSLSTVDTSLVPTSLLDKFKYIPANQTKSTIAKLIPKKTSQEDFERELNMFFKNVTGISHYVF